jgi:hypothetical protein
MIQRQAVTETIATRDKRASRADKGGIRDDLCATTGWHRNHARKALTQALRPTPARAVRGHTGYARADHQAHALIRAALTGSGDIDPTTDGVLTVRLDFVNAVRAGQHPPGDRHRLHAGVRRARRPRQIDAHVDQLGHPEALGQFGRSDQPGV